MSTSSGFGPSSTVTNSGSSAMPQIGQAPGSSLTTSGSIGQIHFVPGGASVAGRPGEPPIASRCPARNFAGCASNLCLQPAEQK